MSNWINCRLQGSLEDQLVRLKEYEQNVYAYKSHMEELEKLNQGIQESMVFENRYTQYTMETLRVGWEQLLTSINRNINEVENQILTRDSKGIQLKVHVSQFYRPEMSSFDWPYDGTKKQSRRMREGKTRWMNLEKVLTGQTDVCL